LLQCRVSHYIISGGVSYVVGTDSYKAYLVLASLYYPSSLLVVAFA